MPYYVIGLQEEGHATGDVCGPYDSPAEAAEMAVSGQIPVVPLPWLLELIDHLVADHADRRHHHDREHEDIYSYHSGCEEGLRHLLDHLNGG